MESCHKKKLFNPTSSIHIHERSNQRSLDHHSHSNHRVHERIRSNSASSYSARDDHECDDASMSNDASMSSSSSCSSFEMDNIQSPSQNQKFKSNPSRHETSSCNEYTRQLPYHPTGIGPGLGGSCSPLRTRNFSFDVVASSSSSLFPDSLPLVSRLRNPQMWLLVQFAPAMSKRILESLDSSIEMEDEESFHPDIDEINEGFHPMATHQEQEQEQLKNRSRNRRVPWASSCAWIALPEGVRLTCARNEVTGVQLRLKSNVAFLLTTDTSNWMLPLGHGPRARVAIDTRFIPPHLLKIEVYVVGCVEDENSNLVMETLQRTGVSNKAAKEHAVYLRIRVGEKLEPGVYELPLRVFTQDAGFCDEYLTWSSSFAVSVVDVQLPTPRNWHFRLDLWQHWTALARGHHVSLWSNRHFELIDRYMALLSEMGQKCLSVVATEMPWAGQQCYMEAQNASALFEHAILEVYEDPAHGVPVSIDFTHFDQLLVLGARHHLDHEIEVFGLLSVWRDPVAGFGAPAELTTHHLRPPSTASAPDSASVADVRHQTALGDSGVTTPAAGTQKPDELGQEHRQSSLPPPSLSAATSQDPVFVIDGWRIRCQDRTTQCVRYLRRVSEIETFIEQFYAHCVALKIADRVRICADEPREVAVFHEQLRFIQRLAPTFRVKLAVNHSEFFTPTYAPPQVADYVPLLPLVCADLDVTRRLANDARARGGHVCWYVCCGPAFPNQFVSSPLVEGELVGYLTFFFELDGFLRWNYCLWPDRPWDDLRWRASMWKVGDMYFVLPGQDGWPVETLRLESLRFAGQAFELLRLAQETLPPAQMQQLQRTITEQILRSNDLEEFGRNAHCAREDLYSVDPLDYQRAKTIILNTLAAAGAVKDSGV
ncbi:unnamed protein product [Peronospora belbahrii]|uniref:Glycoside hydrolase 123 catalytic domain-containing protein n=1 Tax=Peronospora belbahrii TaxID=622444 RepID=A0AAU9KRK3_9STRA|nr:unnamed protein product [Peronospora belbahrii]CAH0519693.1 unnamed protein product [Peronospora belbahrii]